MAQDEKLLLSGRDWLEIVAVALEEASRSRGADLRARRRRPGRPIGRAYHHGLAEGGGRRCETRTRRQGDLLFGETLKAAVISSLRAVASNPALAAEVLAGAAPDAVTPAVAAAQGGGGSQGCGRPLHDGGGRISPPLSDVLGRGARGRRPAGPAGGRQPDPAGQRTDREDPLRSQTAEECVTWR